MRFTAELATLNSAEPFCIIGGFKSLAECRAFTAKQIKLYKPRVGAIKARFFHVA
jgi:hypothetical protein